MLLYTILRMVFFLSSQGVFQYLWESRNRRTWVRSRARAFSKTYFKFAKYKPILKYDPTIAHICKQPARINLAGKPCRYALPLASCPLNTVNPR